MPRRVGLPAAYAGAVGKRMTCRSDVALSYSPFGRSSLVTGPFHTFVDDWRQEQFWRRPEESLIKALSAELVIAPDYTVFENDSAEWASYQVWRSAAVATYWAAHGVSVLPVVSFWGHPERFIDPGSVWAIRGPARGNEKTWEYQVRYFVLMSSPSFLVVFGRSIELDFVEVLSYPLLSRKCPAVQIEV